MAAETVKAGVQTTEEIVGAAVERSKLVMARQWAVYDHEKVFWNSVWTVGIIGLGWTAVKLGLWLDAVWGMFMASGATARGLEPLVAVKFYFDQPAFGIQKQFFEVVDYVELKHKDVTERPSWIHPMAWNAIERFRSNTVEYENFKKNMFKKWTDAYPPSSQRQTLEEQYAIYLNQNMDVNEASADATVQRALSGKDLLESMDKFFSTYGAVLPFAAVAGHMGLESLRVYKTRKHLKLDEGIKL